LGTKLYNKLPNYFKKLRELQPFKRQLKALLLQQTFYSGMNICPMCRHPEGEFNGKVWY
jgi:hypothetical protein